MSINILVIDDDSVDRMAVKRAIKKLEKDVVVSEVETGKEGLKLMQEETFDCVFLDYLLPDMDGVKILYEIQDKKSALLPCPIIMLTGQGNEKIMMEALLYGAQDYLIKNNISPDTLHIALTKARQIYDLRKNQYEATKNLEIEVERRTKEYQEQTKFLDKIVENLPLALFAKDIKNESRWIMFNQFAEELLGWNHKELIGKTDHEYFPQKKAHFFTEGDGQVMTEGKVVEFEGPVTTTKGIIRAHTIKVPIYDEQGEPSILLGILQDVTAQKTYQDELEHAKNLAEEANKTKDQFLANMSHELRTPLNSIIGLVKMLLPEPDIADEHRQTLEVIDKASVSLLKVVNDVLDISKIEAGKVELEEKKFNVSYLLLSLMDQLKPLASKNGLVLKSNTGDLPPWNIVGDEFRLSRILLNLIGNAIKYTVEGHVEIVSAINARDDGEVDFICQINDTGIGIADEKIERVFDKFTQAEESTERRFGGTGLGLNITKQLVELMGGEISVESKIGQGSTFTVQIPFTLGLEDVDVPVELATKQNRNHLKNIKRAPIDKVRILVAEDHEFNQVFIIKLLERLNCTQFNLVTNGEDAVSAFKEGGYDMILMDCHMPQMNGYDATRSIREYEFEHESKIRIPIIAMTADAMVGTREACLESGMDEYISKPIDEDEFRVLIAHWFSLKSEAHSSEKTDDDQKELPPADLTILKDYTDNDPDTEKELIDLFYKKSIADLKILEKNRNGGKNKIWSEASHNLKGGAAYIGAYKLHKLAEKAQDMPSDATSKERSELFEQMYEEYTRVCEFLKQAGFLKNEKEV